MKQNGKFIKPLASIAAIGALAWLATGCSTEQAGGMAQATATQVQLKGNNYKVIKAGAMGQSSGFSLLGIIPFASPNYAEAKASLYANVGEPLTGKSIALANQTEDKSTLYLILFSIPKVTITADVVEFTGESKSE